MTNQERYKAYLSALFSFEGIDLPEGLGINPADYGGILAKANQILESNAQQKLADEPLVAILSRVFEQDKNSMNKYFFEPSALEVVTGKTESDIKSASIFPKLSQQHFSPINDEKTLVLNALQTALNAIPTKDPVSFAHTAYHLLHKYLTRSRSAACANYDDVSVFDHQRMLAAVVNCLTHPQYKNNDEFVLIKGDISGIQKFIYGNIDLTQVGGSDNLSKKLRGRSFYISLLTNFIAERFIEQLDLFDANLIYATGGHFMIVAPKYEQVFAGLDKLTKDINKKLRKKLGNNFNFLLGAVEAKPDLFIDATTYFERLEARIRQQKTSLHKTWLKEVLTDSNEAPDFADDLWLGTNMPYSEYLLEITLKKGYEDKHLKITSRNPKDKRKFFTNITELVDTSVEEDKRKDRSLVVNLLDWDRLYFMPRSRKDPERIDKENKEEIVNPYEEDLPRLKKEIETLLDDYREVIESVTFISLNKTDIEGFFDPNSKVPIHYKFTFLGSESRQFFQKEEPLLKLENNKPGDVMHFDGLQMLDYTKQRGVEANLETGQYLDYPMLGVMRMDVDFLGGIFVMGLGDPSDEHSKKGKTFARLATLSRELHMFFSGYFNVLVHKYQLYTTYSGGDDAFLVGSWYNLMHFAREVYHKFNAFACYNPYLSFSAGLFFCQSNYPVGRFARQAELLEKKSKKFERLQDKQWIAKGAITVFDHTLDWKNYNCMMRFGDTMLKHVNNQTLSRSLVHRLLRLIKSTLDRKNSIDVLRLHRLNTARLHNLFARHGFNNEEINNATQDLTQEVIKIVLDNFKDPINLNDFIVAISYVLWKTRKTNALNRENNG
jgi:CRISPR-associated protein Csm1